MKLARKFVGAMTLVVIVVLGVSHVFSVAREEGFYIDHVHDYHVAMARMVGSSVDERSSPVGELTSEGSLSTVRLSVGRADASRDELPHTEVTSEGYRTRIPLEGGRGVVEVAETLTARDELRRGLWQEWAMTAAALVLVAAVVMLVLGARWIGAPMDRLVRHARRVGAGDLRPEPHPRQDDEVGVLSVEMNQMCLRIQEADRRAREESTQRTVAMEQLRRADRLGTAGQLAAGVAHELGTPLNIAQGRAQLIADDPGTPPASRRNARIVVEQVARMSGIIQQLLGFTRRGRAEVGSCDLGELARSSIELLRSMAKKESVDLRLEVEAESPGDVRADFALLGQVVVNLVVNAIQARRGHTGVVSVSVGGRVREGARESFLSVVDDGVGITEEDAARLFEPFFTTKDVGRGSGLGLWVSHEIVKEFDGRIEVESQPGQGSTFRVVLPSLERGSVS